MIHRAKNMKLRNFFFILTAALIVCNSYSCSPAPKEKILQKPLPYAENALEPYISARTVSIHYSGHHAGYVSTLNNLLENHSLKGKKIEEIVKKSSKYKDKNPRLFNNAAQVWNHRFFWESLRPGSDGKPGPLLANRINGKFENFETFKLIFQKAAADIFGSGWVWLVEEKEGLSIVITRNADTPLAYGMTPLLTIDVWEHSYYIDYKNKRAEYVKNILEHLVDWKRVETRLKRLKQ